MISRRAAVSPPQPSTMRSVDIVRDHQGLAIDLSAANELLERIIAAWHPEQIWLFGSRSRGNALPSSDWDLLAVVPDDSSDDALDPLVSWRLRKESGVRADVVLCRRRDFEEDRMTANTLAYEAATEGVLIFER